MPILIALVVLLAVVAVWRLRTGKRRRKTADDDVTPCGEDFASSEAFDSSSGSDSGDSGGGAGD